MAKKGMKRPDNRKDIHAKKSKNQQPPVPESESNNVVNKKTNANNQYR